MTVSKMAIKNRHNSHDSVTQRESFEKLSAVGTLHLPSLCTSEGSDLRFTIMFDTETPEVLSVVTRDDVLTPADVMCASDVK